MAHQLGDILRPLGQRRHRDREDVQAVEQILAEAARRHVGGEIAVGGGDDPRIHLDGLARPHRLDLALLDGAQQLDLGGRRQLADLVQEQRAARSLDELAGMAVGRAREGALLVAEQERLHQVVRDGAAIDRHERLGAPLAGAVDRPRDQLLADPRWPEISTGMAEVAALPAVRSTACMHGLRVTMSRNVMVPARLRLMRASSPCSAPARSALRATPAAVPGSPA